MERCMDCNSLLTKEEKVCIECGTKVGGEGSSAAGLIAPLVSILFYVSVITMVAAPFVDRAPSFMLCALTSCALLFVMRTAKDGAHKVRK